MGAGTGVKMGDMKGDTLDIIYRALSRVNTNTPVKSTWWRGPQDENRNNLEGAARRDKQKKQEKKYKRRTQKK